MQTLNFRFKTGPSSVCRDYNTKNPIDNGIDEWMNRGQVPIQIKSHRNKVGEPDIRNFVGALGDKNHGIFVAWGFTPSAYEYKAKTARRKRIDFIDAEDILGSLILDSSKRIKHQQLYDERIEESKKKPRRVA